MVLLAGIIVGATNGHYLGANYQVEFSIYMNLHQDSYLQVLGYYHCKSS